MLKISGLYTSYNELLAPEGSLKIAKNVNINVPNLAEPRKGFDRLTTAGWNVASERTEFLGYWNGTLVALHNNSVSAGNSEFYYLNAGVWTFFGNISTPDHYYSAQASGNFFLTSNSGVQKRDALTQPSDGTAGMPAGIGLEPAVVIGTNNWLLNGDSVAYRAVFVREDANENLLFGSPTNRAILTNSSGANRATTVRVDIAFNVEIGDFVRLYRSVAVSTGSPNDELQQVAEFQLTSTEINQGYIDFTDQLDEALLGAALYTNASQEGIENANVRPPNAKDIATFRDSMFYGNTRTRDSIKITLTDAALLSNNDTVSFVPTIGSTLTCIARATEDLANRHFQLFTSGTTEENVRNTCKSLCRVISHNILSVGFNAYYLENEATGNGLGEIIVERRTLEANEFFTLSSANTPTVTPFLPATLRSSGADTPSSRDEFGNGLYWSKPNEPEATPLPNQIRIGNRDSQIQRIVALEEALMIFKEDGLYRLTGYYPDFEVEQVDASVRLIGTNTAAVLSNEIYCLTQQGVMVVSGSGTTRIISTPLEDEIIEKFNTHLTNMKDLSFGVGYEATRRYYLFHPENSGDTQATRAYVYNIYTKTWTTHEIGADAGLAVDNEFWLGDGNSEFVLKERNTGTNRDYADYGFDTTITNVNGRVLTIGSSVDNISIGDVVEETSTKYAIVDSIDTINSTVTVSSDPGFSIGTVSILQSIPIEMRWLPWDMKQPHVNKQIHTVAPFFKAGFGGDMTLTFKTDLEPGEATASIPGSNSLGWGLAPWGLFGWGDVPLNKPYRQWVPRSKQRCTWMIVGLRHSYSFSRWQLQGIQFVANPGNERTSR